MHYFLKFIFGIKLYIFQTVPLSTIRSISLYTQQWYVIQVCWQLASRIRMEPVPAGSGWNRSHPDPARKLSANLYDTYLCCVYSETLLMMDRGTVWNMQSFIPKINLRN